MAKFAFTRVSLKAFFEAHHHELAWDETQRGLAAYSTSAGITLFVEFRVGAKQRKKALGRLGELTIQQARTKAAEYNVAGRHGRDILEEQRRAAHREVTLGDAYLAHREALVRKGASKTTLALTATNWRLRLARHCNRPLTSLTRKEVREWHQGWKSIGAAGANNCARMLKTIITFGIKHLDVDINVNPAAAITHFPQINHRPVLTVSDLPTWWQAVERIENASHRAYFKLLLFTGLRRMDAASIKLVDIHEDRVHRPNPKGGAKKAFDVPITVQLSEVLDEALAARAIIAPQSEYLFPANGKTGHFCGQWHDQPMGVSPHALRRTYASACIAAGLDLVMTKALLNHQGGGDVTLTSYIKVALAQKMAAATRVADFLSGYTKA
jgi:integrase